MDTTKSPTDPQKLPSGELSGAANCSACNGCQWQAERETPSNWCYMFETAPEMLPCSQHDKFEGERKVMGELIKRDPRILDLIVSATESFQANV